MKPKVYFVGAGPGDPELITVKGRRLLDRAEVIIYAGSLVNRKLFACTKAECLDSASMTLDEIIGVIRDRYRQGKRIVRLHTGDTSFYSAIGEQISRLNKLRIRYEIVPGVSSASAGAAALNAELTLPEISQTVIITRISGRTPVPVKQKLSRLAKHNATMVIFLSVGLSRQVQKELLAGYPANTPVAVVEKASWPKQRVLRGRLNELAAMVTAAKIKKTALIYVGKILDPGTGVPESKLYHKDFKHEYRP